MIEEKFTLTQLQSFFETVLDKKFDKGNFRKKIDLFQYVKETEEFEKDVPYRPSRLFKFDKKLYQKNEESS